MPTESPFEKIEFRTEKRDLRANIVIDDFPGKDRFMSQCVSGGGIFNDKGLNAIRQTLDREAKADKPSPRLSRGNFSFNGFGLPDQFITMAQKKARRRLRARGKKTLPDPFHQSHPCQSHLGQGARP